MIMSSAGYATATPAPELQAVTFDMDGLLVDSEPLWFQAESTVMARLHGTWGQGDQDALVGGSMTTTVAYLINKGTRPVEPAAVARWLLAEMVSLLRTAPVPVLPGVLELVEEVRVAGLPYALVTSSEPEVVAAVLASIEVPFPVVVCAADVARTKPDPEGYLLAAAKLRAEPGHCIALEDSVNGVRAAEAAGYQTVAVPSVAPVPAAPGRVVLPSLAGVTLEQLAALAGFAI
jgi:HAD superfamily hydrolase (TIGR01509 family)